MDALLQHPITRVGLYSAAAMVVAKVGYDYVRLYCKRPNKPDNNASLCYPMYDTLLAFGDSITQFGSNPGISGFVLHLSGYYSRRMDVLNRGFSGYNTRDALRIASHVFPQTKDTCKKTKGWPWRDFTYPQTPKAPRLCLLFFGANDARLAPYPQHVPLDEFYDNLHKLVLLLRDPGSDYYSPDTRIVLITPPAIGDRMVEDISMRNGHEPDRKNSVTKMYADAVKRVGEEMSLPVVDIWSAIEDLVHGASSDGPSDSKTEDDAVSFARDSAAEQDQPVKDTGTGPYEGYEKYLMDGLHLNRGGNELLFKLIVSQVVEAWPDLNPEKVENNS